MTTEEPETPPDGGGPTAGTNWHSWAALEASLRDDAELSDDLRARTLDAVVVLQALLGDEWLGQVTLDHPILSLFWNRAEWTRVRLCALADGLTAINRLPGGAQLLGRVRSEQEAGSALLEIDTAVRALTHGCTVELAPRTQGAKSCDLALTSADDRRLFVEITGVAQFSSEATTQQRLLDRIYPIMDIIGSDHVGGGQLLFWPADDERDALVKTAEAFWLDGLVRTERVVLDVPGTLHLWCEPVREGGPIPDGGPYTLFQAPLHEDPLGRTRRAVRNKVAQLPLHEPGVIFVHPPSSLWLMPDVAVIAKAIASAVVDYPQIVATVLVNWGYSPDRSDTRRQVYDSAELIQSADRHIFVRQSLVVWNTARVSRNVDELAELLA